MKFDVAPHGTPGWPGQLFVALFGDEVPMTAPAGPHVGRAVVRIDPIDWSMHPLIQGVLARPIDVRFDASGESLYLLDFGHFEMHAERGLEALAHSGKLWRLRLTRDAR